MDCTLHHWPPSLMQCASYSAQSCYSDINPCVLPFTITTKHENLSSSSQVISSKSLILYNFTLFNVGQYCKNLQELRNFSKRPMIEPKYCKVSEQRAFCAFPFCHRMSWILAWWCMLLWASLPNVCCNLPCLSPSCPLSL